MDRLFEQQGFERWKISALDRLAFIGDRAIGALSFRPANNGRLLPEDIALLDLAKEIGLIVEGEASAALKQLAMLGGSPQGARPKVLVQYDRQSQKISTDPGASGTAWMIKFQAQHEAKEVCAIEHAYAHLARLCGLTMPETAYFDLDKKFSGFGIERFDRHRHLRVPTSTLAGMLDLDMRTASISYNELLQVTRRITNSEDEVRKSFERCVFNVIFHNRDDHARNFSYRMNQELKWEVAPCYDLTFSSGPGGEHHMAIAGEGRHPGREHLLTLARAHDITPASALDIIDRFASVAGTLSTTLKNFKIGPKTRQEIIRKVEGNRALMLG